MTHNLPDDIHLSVNDPRSPLYDDRWDARQEMIDLRRREDIIDCIVNGYTETDDGDDVPLQRFAEYVIDCAQNGTGAVSSQCELLLIFTMHDGDSNKMDTRKLRREVAYHFVMMEENL